MVETRSKMNITELKTKHSGLFIIVNVTAVIHGGGGVRWGEVRGI